MAWRIAGWISALGLVAAVLASETVRAWVLIIMLLVSFAGFVRFLITRPLGLLLTGLVLGGLSGCRGDE